MKIQTFVVGKLRTNCYIVYDEKNGEACVVDPGGDFDKLDAFITQNQLNVKNIFLTHGHFDHILVAAQVKEKTGESSARFSVLPSRDTVVASILMFVSSSIRWKK